MAKKRVNVTLPEAECDEVARRSLNLSGLLSDLLGDHLAADTITLRVGADTRRLYEEVVANTGYGDADLEEPLRRVLAELLDRRIAELEALRQAVSPDKT